MNTRSTQRRWVWLTLIVLVIAHQDFWFWDDSGVVLGFLPVGLAYHALFSIVATCAWFAVVHFAWHEDEGEET